MAEPKRWTQEETQLLIEYANAHMDQYKQVNWKGAEKLFKNRNLAQITSKFNRLKCEDVLVQEMEPFAKKAPESGNPKKKFQQLNISDEKIYSSVPGNLIKAWAEYL